MRWPALRRRRRGRGLLGRHEQRLALTRRGSSTPSHGLTEGHQITHVELPEHTVAPHALSRKRRPGEGTLPMSAHIIGRPNDDLLDIMLGHGADPEQALIRGSETGLEEGDGSEDHLPDDEPTVPELCP